MNHRRLEIIGATVIVLLLVLSYVFISYFKTYSNRVSYPHVTPYTITRYKPEYYPITLDKAIEIANKILEKEGVPIQDYYVAEAHATGSLYGIKFAVALITYKCKYDNESMLFIWLDLLYGRPMFIDIDDPRIAPYKCPGMLLGNPEEFAEKAIRDKLEDFGYNMSGIGIKALRVHYYEDGWLLVDYTLVIHGYLVDTSEFIPSALICLLPGGDYKIYTMWIPTPIIYIYYKGYFINPPNPLPISKDKAISIAVNYVKNHYKLTEYKYEYQGVYWMFHTWNKTDVLDPVPHLEHVITFWVSVKGGGQYHFNVTVDAITGKAGV